MNRSFELRLLLLISFVILSLSACISRPENELSSPAGEPVEGNKDQPNPTAKEELPLGEAPEGSFAGYEIPENLVMIDASNAAEVEFLGQIVPETPPFYAISGDGRLTAVGGSKGLTIIETSTGSQISQFNVELPNCAYGSERYFQFNHDGSFIAVITKVAIQVWQTGSGLIYEGQHSRVFSNQYPPCGFDLPQISLSPEGRLLAVNGIDYSKAEPTRYFRVVDVIANEILYEWNGLADTLHGNFSSFFGLGFSSDSQYIQTFDPKRYLLAGGELHRAFRFWSTNTWEEATNPNVIRKSFEAGELLFPKSISHQVTFFDKLTGEIMAEIPAQGCEWDTPCEAVFSRNGTKAVLLPNVKPPVQFGNHLFFQKIEIWDMEKEEVYRSIPGFYRNLDGLKVADNGELIIAQSMDTILTDDQTWSVTADLFQGLQTTQEGEIAFIPNRVGSKSLSECQFCNTCFLQVESGEINCRSGIEGSHGWYSIQMIDSEYWIIKHNADGDGPVGKLSLQPPSDPESQRMRLSGYSETHQTAFYCQDVEFRPQKCVIDDLGSGQLVEEFLNISLLRMSPDGNFASFLDSSRNTLFIFDLDSQELSRRSHYQAKAAITDPVFSKDGRTLYYLVENLKKKNDFSIEILDVIAQKVIKRSSLGMGINQPKAIAINQTENLLAVANAEGNFVLVSLEQPKVAYKYQSSQNGLMGIGFGLNDKVMVVLDNLGNYYLWGIDQ